MRQRIENGFAVFGIGDQLRDAVMIAQIDEQQIAVIALAVHPAGEFYFLADMGLH